MFDSVFALMSSQVEGLSCEVIETGSQALGCGEPQPQLSVLGSTNPQTDCATILWLFPHKYSQTNSPEAMLLQERENPTTGTTIMLIHCGVDVPVQWRNAVLILEEIEISSAVSRCHHRAATVFHQENIEISWNQYTTLAVVRLTGGANLVLLTAALIRSNIGRAALADFVASRELIESNESRGSSALREENWLTEIEQEFSIRRGSHLAENDRNASVGTMSTWAAPFSNLQVALQRKHGFLQRDVPVNSKSPLTFETDLFVGKIVLFMKPSDPDEGLHNKFCKETKASFILQIQGKFKYIPTGTLFAGAELTCDELKPALVTKGLCGLLLKAIKKKHQNMHSSYGDFVEKPHIVVPAWTFFDRIVRTKPSDKPPSIEEPFFEPSGSVSARQKSGSIGAWNTIDTYSFGSFCPFLDFPLWQLVNVPFCRDTSLHNFWGDSMVRLVLYEQRDNANSMEAVGLHKPAANSYLFSLQLEHLTAEADSPNKPDEEVDVSEGAEVLPWGKVRARANFSESFASEGSGECNQSLSDDELEEDDLIAYIGGDRALSKPSVMSLPSKVLLSVVDSSCPAWFDIIAKDKKYTKVYAFRQPKQPRTFFRTVLEFQAHLDTSDAIKHVTSVSSSRISYSEETRRVLGYAYFQGQSRHAPKVRQLNTAVNVADSHFLKRPPPEFQKIKIKQEVVKSGYIARAISDHHWREEFVRLLDHYVAFFHPERLKPHFRINLKSVIKGRKLPPDEAPDMPGYSFLELETIGRKIYLMFSSEETRDEWTAAMNEIILKYRKTETASNRLDGFDNPTEQFMHQSSKWKCEKRLLLNCRHFSFRPPKFPVPAGELMEEALLLSFEARETGNETAMVHFLDKASALKDVDVYQLQGDERVAFLINLYHLMIMHAYLLLGPPESSFTYVNMMKMVSYQMSDDIFSLTELELNIIRGNSCYPVDFAPRYVLPKSSYGFAPTKMDMRVNFCLNSGSLSSPRSIPIYKASIIEMQFDSAAVVFLEAVKVEEDKYKLIVTLPRLFLWYAEDFGSPFEMMIKIAPYLNGKNQDALNSAGYNKRIVFKYTAFDFQCEPLGIDDNRARKFRHSPVIKSKLPANAATVTKKKVDEEEDDGLVMEEESNEGFVVETDDEGEDDDDDEEDEGDDDDEEDEEDGEDSAATEEDFVEVPM
jgi:Protein of unknown function, DUF547/Protein of unknown function (DUF1769)